MDFNLDMYFSMRKQRYGVKVSEANSMREGPYTPGVNSLAE